MLSSTIAALDGINRRFYRRHAAEFSRSRDAPWPGWERVVARLDAAVPAGRPAILDAGCGNARLALYLEARLGRPFSYLGVDASPRLLAIAAERLDVSREDRRLQRLDLVTTGVEARLPRGPFDLVSAFGLLHHVPAAERRRALVEALATRLRGGGLLALSFWQFGESPRLRRRIVPWHQRPDLGIRTVDLEEGDHLLAWGGGGAVRYCHLTGPEEAETLVAGLGLRRIDSYRADGKEGLNLYYLLRRPTAAARTSPSNIPR